jgi:hypothetical protein
MSLNIRSTPEVFQLYDNGLEVLTINWRGNVITRARRHDGHLEIQIQHLPKLVRWLVGPKKTIKGNVTFSLQKIPEPEASLVNVPEMIAIFHGDEMEYPVLVSMEPLRSNLLRRILANWPRVTAVFNAGRVHIPRGSAKLAKGLR